MYGMPDRLQYFAVRYRMGNQKPGRDLVAMGPKQDVVYWGGSPSHWARDGFSEFEILKNYGWEDEWSDDFDVDRQYVLDFPPVTADIETYLPKDTEGILAPDGAFYPCGYGEHTYLARNLLTILDIEEELSAEDTLLKRGYLSVRYAIIGASYDSPPTEAQVRWLKRAKELNANKKYSEKVQTYLRHWQ